MLKIYLETTIFNFPFANDAPQYRDMTRDLFYRLKSGLFVPYTSEYVVDELKKTQEFTKQDKMLSLIKDYDINILKKDSFVQKLANIYIEQGIIPQKYDDDARHIACCSFYGLDMIVSLNFKHIVKIKTKIMCQAVNRLYGLKCPYICTPEEVIYYEEDI